MQSVRARFFCCALLMMLCSDDAETAHGPSHRLPRAVDVDVDRPNRPSATPRNRFDSIR